MRDRDILVMDNTYYTVEYRKKLLEEAKQAQRNATEDLFYAEQQLRHTNDNVEYWEEHQDE